MLEDPLAVEEGPFEVEIEIEIEAEIEAEIEVDDARPPTCRHVTVRTKSLTVDGLADALRTYSQHGGNMARAVRLSSPLLCVLPSPELEEAM
jgi:hypothetical protein